MMAQGVGVSYRLGTQILIKSIFLKVYGYSQATTTANLNRVILFLDRQANGGAPTYADVVVGNEIDDFTNLNNRKRFKILRDLVFHSPVHTADNDGYYQQFYLKFKKGILVQYYTTNTGTYQDICTNSLWVWLISDASNSSTASYFDVNCRIRFYDS